MWNHLLFWRTFWNEGTVFSERDPELIISMLVLGSFFPCDNSQAKRNPMPKHTREEGGPERKGASLNQPPCVLQLARARKE